MYIAAHTYNNNRPAATWGHCGRSVMMRQTNAIHQGREIQPWETVLESNNVQKTHPPQPCPGLQHTLTLILGLSALVGKETPG